MSPLSLSETIFVVFNIEHLPAYSSPYSRHSHCGKQISNPGTVRAKEEAYTLTTQAKSNPLPVTMLKTLPNIISMRSFEGESMSVSVIGMSLTAKQR